MIDGGYQGRIFMYPCAGFDIVEPVQALADQFDTFVFVDIKYRFDRFSPPSIPGWDEVLGSVQLTGPATDAMRVVQRERGHHREIEPAWRRSCYRNPGTGRAINLVFRRGFGQYALHELCDGTLGMFLHRGDSGGEGGSGTFFLANHRMSHPPLSMLVDVIKRKLGTPALIASDGSNTNIRQLCDAAAGDDGITAFRAHGLGWERSGSLPGRQGRRTVVWRVAAVAGTDASNRT